MALIDYYVCENKRFFRLGILAMTQKELIIKNVEGIPNALLDELADFLRFLKMKADEEKSGSALMSESSLKKDWLRPEEEEAWKDL